MKEFFVDLHVHSKYSRACSKQLDLEHLAACGAQKGLDIIASADITHPKWLSEIKEKLIEVTPGIFALKKDGATMRFVLSTELSSIFSRDGKCYRMHYVIMFPSFLSVDRLVRKLLLLGVNVASDGRPILGIDPKEVLRMVLEVDEHAIFIPAHIWTPWFSVFGSHSGFESMEDAFGDLTPHIFAVETGLSSDPQMNWRLSQLDPFSLVSFSDAHSAQPHRVGREATVLKLEELSFLHIKKALDRKEKKNTIVRTIEFYPEEGKYHFDGHRICGVCLSPKESKKNKYMCPACGKGVTVGVMSRVEQLADRKIDFFDDTRPPFTKTVPLSEVIAAALKTTPTTKKVNALYDVCIKEFGSEFALMLSDKPVSHLPIPGVVIHAIDAVRAGDVFVRPGYDGEYGVVSMQYAPQAPTHSLFTS